MGQETQRRKVCKAMTPREELVNKLQIEPALKVKLEGLMERTSLWKVLTGKRTPSLRIAFIIQRVTGIKAKRWIDE